MITVAVVVLAIEAVEDAVVVVVMIHMVAEEIRMLRSSQCTAEGKMIMMSDEEYARNTQFQVSQPSPSSTATFVYTGSYDKEDYW